MKTVPQIQEISSAMRASWVSVPGWLRWGALIGLVQIFAMLTYAPLGISTAYPQLVGYILDRLSPGFAQQQLYLQEIGAKIGWEVMEVLGVFLGALLAHWLSRRGSANPMAGGASAVCIRGFEGSPSRRWLRAFAGGFLILFGARLANGCTTGHMLSGIAQMAVSGFLFGAVAFATGLLAARLLFREPIGGATS